MNVKNPLSRFGTSYNWFSAAVKLLVEEKKLTLDYDGTNPLTRGKILFSRNIKF
jgi:hypothetical protein